MKLCKLILLLLRLILIQLLRLLFLYQFLQTFINCYKFLIKIQINLCELFQFLLQCIVLLQKLGFFIFLKLANFL